MAAFSSSTPALLSMRGIEKRFNGVPALSGASLEIGRSEIHALIGQNGAGKSTMIKVLTGYYSKDAGEVIFDGAPFHADSPKAAQASGISTIYQEINLVSYRSVTENICLGRERKRFGFLDWPRMHREAEEILARFDVHLDVRQPLSRYTTAIQQMVAIARAVSFQARLVIMDEPTSSLDDHEVAVLFGVIRQLKDSGVSVIFVSHKLDELYVVCERVTVMRDGRTVLVAPLAQVSKLELVTTMIGREIESPSAGQTAFHEIAPAHRRQKEKALLEVQHLAVGRRVTDCSFDVHPGEIVGLAGLLGSGRTESVRTVFGADRPDSGRMRYQGKSFAPQSPAAAIGAGIGFCSEDRKLEGIVPEMSVRENLTLALLPRLARSGVVNEEQQRQVVNQFIERIRIKCASPDQRIRELSGGNQQKVLLARWLCLSPRLLILDEPTRGIDVGAKAEIQGLIGKLAAEGLGVLMISSEIEEIVEGSDRVFVLREGRTVAELEKEAITEDAIMAAMAEPAEPPTHPDEAGPLTGDGATAVVLPPGSPAQDQPRPGGNGAGHAGESVQETPATATATSTIIQPVVPRSGVADESAGPAVQPAGTGTSARKSYRLEFLKRQATLTALLVLILFNFLFTPHFATWETLYVNLTQVCTIVIVGVGMTLVIGSGGIDLSVGSLMAIAGSLAPIIFLGKLVPLPVWCGVGLAFIVPVLVAGALGWFNGWLITRFKIQPIVATLVLFIAGRGIAQVMTNGNLQVFHQPAFQVIGLGRVFGLPVQSIIMAFLVVVAAWALRRTVFGRQLLAVGGNEEAARLSGIPVVRVKRAVYALSGICAGIAGLIVIAINSSSDANLVGLGMELDAIAAVAVGGTLLLGGQAYLVGTLAGALIIQLVRYTLLANGVPDAAALVVKAAMIIGAVYFQRRGGAR
ncbi:MAG: ATP-binding cassette domain-containing protein [Verrucomicrobia bacterium]|nr:ATP-binding cassette domain-containing protein [Verrucomicrobiota bacterium]